MADRSTIEWTQATWNPTTGCDRISPGCDNCYALTLAARLKAMGSPKYQHDGDPRTSGPGFGVTVHPDAVNLPLRWRAGRRVFVDSMSDLFHARVPIPWVADVVAVMAAARQHTYQVLTKRPGRARTLFGDPEFVAQVRDRALGKGLDPGTWAWPLPHLWLGVSVEDQVHAERRVPVLLDTPAAVRWVSAEPLLGRLDLAGWLAPAGRLCGPRRAAPGDMAVVREFVADLLGWRGLDWVVAGGESGPGARPVDPAWVRGLRDQCEASAVPIFFKQWGGRTPKTGGRELDGRTWNEFPDLGGGPDEDVPAV